jgi:hypothetical protein
VANVSENVDFFEHSWGDVHSLMFLGTSRVVSRTRYTISEEFWLIAYRLIAQSRIAYRLLYRDTALARRFRKTINFYRQQCRHCLLIFNDKLA